MIFSLGIIVIFALGIGLGIFNLFPSFIINFDCSTIILYCLLFSVGIGIGSDNKILNILKNIDIRILYVPLSIVLGTYFGAICAFIFVKDISLNDSLAVASGFGYYSLSSILITNSGNEMLGVIALISNILREIVTLLFTPLLSKYVCKFAPIASGGATSMDTTLPIIIKYSDVECGLISICSGLILTIVSPFLVLFFLNI